MENVALFSPEDKMRASDKKERLCYTNSGLHRKILIFFIILILMASVLSVVAIFHHNKGEVALHAIAVLVEGGSILAEQNIQFLHESLMIMTVMTVSLVCVLIVFMVFFIRDIIKPLNRLEKLTRQMADGSLNLLVQDSDNATSSISAIGENVNSIAMNLQEVLLLTWNLSEHNLETVDETMKLVTEDSEIPGKQILARLLSLKAELQQMQDITRQFELFDVTLQGKKALAKDEITN